MSCGIKYKNHIFNVINIDIKLLDITELVLIPLITKYIPNIVAIKHNTNPKNDEITNGTVEKPIIPSNE